MFCTKCGHKKQEVWTGEYLAATGEKEWVEKCLNEECSVGKENACVNAGGHFYPKKPLFGWFFAPECQRCGYYEAPMF